MRSVTVRTRRETSVLCGFSVSTLPPHTPENDRLDVAEGTTAGEAMHILNIRSAETLILVNGVHAGPDRILNDGDRLAFVPAAEAANS